MNIKQIKMADGSEVICEIIEELEEDVVVRFPLRISRVDLDHERSYYMFKPWLTYVEKSDHFVTVNTFHMMAATIPSKEIMEQYESAIERIEQMEKIEETVIEKVEDSILSHDSSYENIIKLSFVDRSKMH